MSTLVNPANVTRTVNLTTRTITVRWQNKNGGKKISYRFQFVSKAGTGEVSKIQFAVSKIGEGSAQKADLIFTEITDIPGLEDYYAEVKFISADAESEWGREEIRWVAGGSMTLTVGGKPLVLSSDNSIVPEVFSGRLDFTQNPVSLTKLANQFLAEFALELPSGFPTLIFYYISGFYSSNPKCLQINALTSIVFDNPFGLSDITFGFRNMMMSIGYAVIDDKTAKPPEQKTLKSLSISADINHTPKGGDEDVKFGSAVIILGNKVNVLGLEVVREISAKGILETLLCVDISPEVAAFLPSFRPRSSTEPIRLYKA